jgi:glucose/arabinose dehydrogenase
MGLMPTKGQRGASVTSDAANRHQDDDARIRPRPHWPVRGATVTAVIAVLLALTFGGGAFPARGRPTLPVAPALEPVFTGLSSPVYVTHSRDGTGRLFAVEQPGRVLIRGPGGGSATKVFLDIRSRVLFGGERGLLGLAFHPHYAQNGRFFVNYTRQPDGATVVAEYRASATNPDVAGSVVRTWLLIAQPFSNHNGGMIEFGPDGWLYVGSGDGGSANDPGNVAQNPRNLLGKILYLDVADKTEPRPGTPTQTKIGWRPEIFALGFRNPWRFSFDRVTGQLYVGDVGQGAWEEIDVVQWGGNYGWRVFEGTHCTGLGPSPCTAFGFIPPVHEYGHTGDRCSVTGGYVYRGAAGVLPLGGYVFGDYCTGEIFLLKNGVASRLLDTAFRISSFGEDEPGELYVVDHLGGAAYRLTRGTSPTPATTRQSRLRGIPTLEPRWGRRVFGVWSEPKSSIKTPDRATFADHTVDLGSGAC